MTPIERAAEAVKGLWLREEVDFEKVARVVLAAALDRDEIALAIYEDDLTHGHASVSWGDLHAETRAWYLRNADAVIADLTGGAS